VLEAMRYGGTPIFSVKDAMKWFWAAVTHELFDWPFRQAVSSDNAPDDMDSARKNTLF
jgi:hypothetical protein